MRGSDTGYLYGSWRYAIDTSRLDPGMLQTVMKQRRFVFHDAYHVMDTVDMREFRRARYQLAAVAAMEIPRLQRRTEVIESEAFRQGWKRLPLWLAIAIASSMDQCDMPSAYAVLMHDPVEVMQINQARTRPRVIAIAEGERENLVTAPRAEASDTWEENRTFVFLEE